MVANEGSERSGLTVGDWVTFLSSEKQIGYGLIAVVVALTLAGMGMAYAVAMAIPITTTVPNSEISEWSMHVETATAPALFLVLICYLACRPLYKKIDRPRKILRDILSGKLSDPEQIQKRWDP